MTPFEMEAIHRAAFQVQRPWTAEEFRVLMSSAHVDTFANSRGFAVARTIAGESELLTLAVHPDVQRKGIGRKLVEQWLASLTDKAADAFLEVASDNEPARALYNSLGFSESGLRKAYYPRAIGPPADAIVMRRRLTFGHGAESPTSI